MKTADLFDDHADRIQVCETQFTIYGQRLFCSGQIETIKCYEDNALVKKTLATPSKGKVLVVDGASGIRTALMGDMIAESAVQNGWVGVIILGAIRDSEDINKLPLHVKALGTCPRKSSKAGVGIVGELLNFGSADFLSGHWIYSDSDGIVISESKLL